MKTEKKDLILIGLNPFNGNRGVGALAYSTIYLLEKISDESNLKFEYHLLGLFPKQTSQIDIGGKTININLIPFQFNGLSGILRFIFTLRFTFRVLVKAHHVLDMGEGDSFSDIYGNKRFKQINNPKKFFRFLGKKQLLLPQTIGPFTNMEIEHEAIKSIKKSTKVLTRDALSYNYVNRIIEGKTKELIDVAFFMPYTKKKFKSDTIHVGINVSALLWHGGYTQNNQFNLKSNYCELINELLTWLLKNNNVHIHLVPHVVLPQSDIENDYEVSRKICDDFNNDRLTLAPFFLDPIEAKDYISGLDFFSGARMHACIAAFSTGVPVFPLAYSRKFTGLFVDSLNYPYHGNLMEQSNNEIIGLFVKAFNQRNELKSAIQNSQQNIINQRYAILIDELKDFLDLPF